MHLYIMQSSVFFMIAVIEKTCVSSSDWPFEPPQLPLTSGDLAGWYQFKFPKLVTYKIELSQARVSA